MKKLALIALVFVALGASAQQDTLKYRISLKDKAATTYSLDHPEKFLSEKAIARRQHHRLELLQNRIADASPQKLLKRGYSITLKDGKAVKSAACLQSGDELITRLYEGEVKSRVE